MHFKRNKIEKFWPIPRKGTKYVAVPLHNQKNSIPLIVAMRDVLKFVRTKKELKRILNENQVLINGKVIKEVNYPLCLFDVLSLPALKKNFRVLFSEKKKIILKEISDKEAESRVYKVIGKKVLAGGKIQLNLVDGRNVLIDEKDKFKTGDSVVFSFKENRIVKVIPLGEKRKAFIIGGKHTGKVGKIKRIIEEGNKKIAEIEANGEKIKVWTKNLVMIENEN